MRYSYSIFVLLGLTISTFSFAGQTEYNDCILKHLKGAKLDVATNYIRMACEENSKKASFISKNRRAYNSCLLEHLAGVESLHAVMEISNACASKHK